MQEYKFNAEAKDVKKRLDVFLTEKLIEISTSRAYLQYLIKQGFVLVNDLAVDASYSIRLNDTIYVKFKPRPKPNVLPQNIPLEILYEDDDILVVNKAAGMVVHPGAGRHKDTLVNAVLALSLKLSRIGGEIRPGIVHRLDKDTSGVLIIAKNDRAHEQLALQFKQHTINRVYLALVEGSMELDQGEVNVPIGRHPCHRTKMAVVYTKSRKAITCFRVLKRFKDYTLLEIKPQTGRTHQIRVHLAHIGHPVLGDASYGKKSQLIKRQALHAHSLGFIHPATRKYLEFSAELPVDMQGLIL